MTTENQTKKAQLRHNLIKIDGVLREFGIDLRNILYFPRGLIKTTKDYIIYTNKIRKMPRSKRGRFKGSAPYLSFNDDLKMGGTNKGHYYHQDLYVAKKIIRANPSEHLDIGSRMDGFIAHLLASDQNVTSGDIRKMETDAPNHKVIYFDLSGERNESKTEKQYESVSSLHTIEHVGLGRYGDTIDPEGHLKAIKNLCRLVNNNGILYVSFPIGKENRVEFNSHRVFSLKEAKIIFEENNLKIIGFAYVDDNGNLNELKEERELDFENSYGLVFGCGIFTVRKKRINK